MSFATAKVAGRRELRYATLDELLTDADRLAAVPVQTLGNWTLCQIYRHLALSFVYSIEGFTLTFPWYMRLMARPFKKQLLAGRMPAGFVIRNEGAKKLTPSPGSTQEGLAELHAAVGRLKQESQRARHPMFGELSHEDWHKVYLQHASLHMSFIVEL